MKIEEWEKARLKVQPAQPVPADIPYAKQVEEAMKYLGNRYVCYEPAQKLQRRA